MLCTILESKTRYLEVLKNFYLGRLWLKRSIGKPTTLFRLSVLNFLHAKTKKLGWNCTDKVWDWRSKLTWCLLTISRSLLASFASMSGSRYTLGRSSNLFCVKRNKKLSEYGSIRILPLYKLHLIYTDWFF